MEIARYIEILWRRKWVVAITLLTTLAVVVLGTALMPKVYAASATIRITEVGVGTVGYSELAYLQRVQNTYSRLLTSRPAMETIIEQLNLNTTADQLAEAVKAEALGNTELIRIRAESDDPARAAQIANAVASFAQGQSLQTYAFIISEPALAPESPDRPRPLLYLLLGSVAGLLAGLGLAFLMENQDGTIHSVERLRAATDDPILGLVPQHRQGSGRWGVLSTVNGTALVESFRVLSATILSKLSARPTGQHQGTAILVTSPEPGTGKTTTLVNLATAMAREGRQVIVVGSDLRHSDLHRFFGLPKEMNVRPDSELDGQGDPALVSTGILGVRMLRSNGFSPLPEGLPTPDRLAELIAKLRRTGQVVLMDSAAVHSSADAAMLAPLVDGILVVAASRQTTERSLDLAIAQLKAVGGTILGVVLNKAKLPRDGNYYDYRLGRGLPGLTSMDSAKQSAESPSHGGTQHPVAAAELVRPDQKLEKAV